MSWQRIDLSDEKYAAPTEPPSLCGLIYRGKRHAISGPPEAAKTLVSLILGLEHMRADQGSFALIDFEMGEHATRLLLSDLGATLDEIAAVYYVTPSGPPAKEDLEALTGAGVGLAIIDSAAGAYDASGLDDNKRADAEMFSRSWVAPLWVAGITTVVLDHVTKNSDARGRYAIGSERKLGTVDVALGFDPALTLSRGGRGLIRVKTHKDRPGHLARPSAAELHLQSDPDTHRIVWEFRQAGNEAASADGWRPTVLMDRVLEFFARNPEPISRSALAGAVKGRREWVLQAVDCLVAEQRLQVVDRKLVPVGNVPEFGNDSEPLNDTNGDVPGTLGNDRSRPYKGRTGTTFDGNDSEEVERLAAKAEELGL